MKSIYKKSIGGFAVAAFAASGIAISAASAADEIILGSAISFTGKYSTNGIHAKNGYDIAVKRINEMGGVKVGGKSYKIGRAHV